MKILVPVSGGKDSQACLKLAIDEAGSENVRGLFCDTQFEHEITYEHVHRLGDLYGVRIDWVCAGSVEEKVKKYKRFPGGGARHCTKELKIIPTKKYLKKLAEEIGGFEVWYGMRTEESAERANRYQNTIDDELYQPHEINGNYPKYLGNLGVRFRLPILEWTKGEVLAFLEGNENPLYGFGFDRVGCFPCLAAGDYHKEKAFTFDETGQRHFKIARGLEEYTGRSVFTSKRGQLKNDSGQQDCFQGCGICAI